MKHETRNSVLGHTGPAGVHLSSWGGSELIFRETVALSPGGVIALSALRPFCLHPSPVLPGEVNRFAAKS